MNRTFRPRWILLFIVLAPLAVFVFGSIVMLLWNNVLVPVLHVSTVTFWQGLGILVLAKILFGSFSGGRRRSGYWKQRLQEKWANMTPEQQEKFKERWQGGRWGHKPWDSGTGGEQVNPGSPS